MGNQPENQQYKNPKAPPTMPGAKDDDFKKQGADRGRKESPGMKKPGAEADDDTDSETE